MSLQSMQGTHRLIQIKRLEVDTINDFPFPPPACDNIPASTMENLEDILSNGNDANGLDIRNVNNLDVLTINHLPYNPKPSLSDVLSHGNDADSIDILNVKNIDVVSINNVPYIPFKVVEIGIQSNTVYPESTGYPMTITFNPPFSAIPAVLANPLFPADFPTDRICTAIISKVTKTSFTIQSTPSRSYSNKQGSANENLPVMWFAMSK